MNDLIKTADYASQQTDRWMFVACLIVLLLFLGMAFRWFVKLLERKEVEAAADREMHRKSIEAIVTNYYEATTKHTDAIRENTAVLQRLLEQRR